MKRWLGLAGLVFVGIAGWRIGDALSPDALSMAVGLLFGVMAGVPTALLVIASDRRRSGGEGMRAMRPTVPEPYDRWGQPQQGYLAPPQPPVIVLTGGAQGFTGQGYAGQAMPTASQRTAADWFPAERPVRQFSVVGEQEHLLEEW